MKAIGPPPDPEAADEDVPEMLLIERDALDEAALAAAGDYPEELAGLAEPPDPRVAKVRRLAVGSLLATFFVPSALGPALGTVLGLWALGLPHDDDETLNRWRLFAAFGALVGLVGTWLAVTKTAY